MSIHYFMPTRYHITIGQHDPVLEIASGDTVETTTVDNHGFDMHGDQITARGNPQTGPFYITEAEPGDTLAVTFDEITPNRSYGLSSSVIAANVVDTDYIPNLPNQPRDRWLIDVKRKVATLDSNTKLGKVSFPIRPMLGCFGVAPPRGQIISSHTSGEHGGNMDYNGFTEGVTVFLPVFVPGALFHLGDGHALQGDGEILGTGVEVSMNVRFTVRVIKDRTIGWPRGADETEIFTLGNARPLEQAVQHATTEMLHWLQDGYNIDPLGAHILLGQNARYDIGNMYNPAYTAVCRLSKHLIPEV